MSKQKQKASKSQSQKTVIIILLVVTGAFFLMRSVHRELYCDEIMYGYKLNATKYGEYWTSPNTALDGEIKSIGDVISSQYNHYFYGNGRSIAHAIEQFFTGVGNINVFYVLNTLLFVFTIILFVRKYMNKQQYLSYLLVTIMFLYLFPYPSKLWYSINLAPNYLLPLSMSLLLYYQFDRLKENCVLPKMIYISAPLVGLLAGWSNEAFAVPIAGAFLIYYFCNIKKLNTRVLLSLIPLWVGTAIMVLSPGNLTRFMNGSGSGSAKMIEMMANAGEILLQLKVLWLLIIAIIFVAIYERKRLIKVFRTNIVVVISIIIGLLFGLVANTQVHSFSAIEFFAMILFCALITPLLDKLKYKAIIAIAITLIYCGHQKMIVNAEKIQVEKQRALIKEFTSNRDGVVLYDNSYITPLVKPYVTAWVHEGASILYDRPFRYKYGEKRVFALVNEDYKALSSFNVKSINKKKVEGDSPFYYFGGQIFIAKRQDVNPNDKYVMRMQDKENPNSYIDVDVKWRLMPSRWGFFCYINYPKDGTPIGIYHKK